MLASGHGAELGELGLRELRRGAPAARVFTWMELTRAASLLSVEPPVAAVQEDLNALRALDQELRAARREADQEPAELLARRARLEARIRRAAWTGPQSRSAQAELAGSGELRSLLGGRYLAEYAAAGEHAGRGGHRPPGGPAGRAGTGRAGVPGDRHAAFLAAAAAPARPARRAARRERGVPPGCPAPRAGDAARGRGRRPAGGRALGAAATGCRGPGCTRRRPASCRRRRSGLAAAGRRRPPMARGWPWSRARDCRGRWPRCTEIHRARREVARAAAPGQQRCRRRWS